MAVQKGEREREICSSPPNLLSEWVQSLSNLALAEGTQEHTRERFFIFYFFYQNTKGK